MPTYPADHTVFKTGAIAVLPRSQILGCAGQVNNTTHSVFFGCHYGPVVQHISALSLIRMRPNLFDR